MDLAYRHVRVPCPAVSDAFAGRTCLSRFPKRASVRMKGGLVGAFEQEQESRPGSAVELVPLDLDGYRIVLAAVRIGADAGVETEIAASLPSVETALRGASAFARRVVEEFRQSGAARVRVEFGCEIAVESGTFLAVIGKATGRSTFTVGLEWDSAQE
jgi:Trypsin-co-occurring domain 1